MTMIRVIDFETSGTEPPAGKVCEVGICDLDLTTRKVRLPRWTKEPRLLPTCPLGKFRGVPWSEVEAGFLGWMLRQPTMEEDLKWNAQREITRRQKGAGL